MESVAAESAVAAVEAMEGDFSCADPIPRADDYAWICEGSRHPVTATVHLYSTRVDGPVFGVTLYTSAPPSADEGDASLEATRALARDLVDAAVPKAWRQPAANWLDAHLPDGGRTRDVEGAGITAAVQPLAAEQWYLELYELDGLETGG